MVILVLFIFQTTKGNATEDINNDHNFTSFFPGCTNQGSEEGTQQSHEGNDSSPEAAYCNGKRTTCWLKSFFLILRMSLLTRRLIQSQSLVHCKWGNHCCLKCIKGHCSQIFSANHHLQNQPVIPCNIAKSSKISSQHILQLICLPQELNILLVLMLTCKYIGIHLISFGGLCTVAGPQQRFKLQESFFSRKHNWNKRERTVTVC